MNNRRGQALIEFVLILPIMMLLMIGIFDVGNLFINKYQLIDELDNIINHQVKVKAPSKLKTKQYQGYTKYTLTKEVTLFTPGIKAVMGGPVKVTALRSVYE